jgi:tRNA A37 threonylcarbamoyladenosine synthetase subunit TsaC/SUA5/YrdC
MFALSILFAFLAPFISRVFWKSFDEVSAAELRLTSMLPEIYQNIIGGMFWAGPLAFVLYQVAELPIELAAGVAIGLITLGLRLPLQTFEIRLLAQVVFWFYRGAVSLKARYIN